MNAGAGSRLIRFGLFEVDLDNARLTRQGVRIHLQEQPFRILVLLLERCGQIVTREELRQELWPAGTYVSFDSGLNTALNRLRVALGDGADNPRFIETVPKRGYRFFAPVHRESSRGPAETAEVNPPPQAADHSPSAAAGPGAGRRRARFIVSKPGWAVAVGAAGVVVALAAFLALHKRGAPVTLSAAEKSVDIGSLRHSVAVLGFQNASGRTSEAWLSTALAEMLRTELGAGGKLRVVPGENVAQLRAGDRWPETDSLSRQTAARIGNALDSELLVLGSFAAIGKAQNRTVRVDFRLQDAQTGNILYEGAESASEEQFFGLAATVGTDLRQRLRLPPISESQEAAVVATLPSDAVANRFYSLGLEKLRAEDVATAKALFLQAERIAPQFPLVHLMLSRAWGALGYDQKSGAEVQRAFALSASLPETDRLLVQGAYYDHLHQRDQAIATYRALFALYPDSVDYGLLLFDALNAAGRRAEALAVIQQLRKLPPPADTNPRIDFAQAMVATSVPAALPLLDRAVSEAVARGQKLLYARFRLQQCIAQVYGPHPEGGVTRCQEAYDILMAAGNRLLAADALRTMGDRRGAKGDMTGARIYYRRALAILRPMGEHEKTGVVLNNMAIGFENQGQIAVAEKLFRQAATTWTECGDFRNAGVALGNLGDVLMVRGQLHEAELRFQRARKQIATTDPDAVAYSLYSIAYLRLFAGDIAGAKRYSEQAMAMARRRKDVNDIASDDEVVGAIEIASDDLAGARRSFEQALEIRTEQADQGGRAAIEAELAAVSLEEGNFAAAEQAFRTSLAEFRTEKAVLEEIATETDLSRALLHEGKLADARQTIADAMTLGANSQDPDMKLPAAIMDARVQAAELASRGGANAKPNLAGVRRKLLQTLTSARHLGYYGIACDARLALAELEISVNPSAARAHLAELVHDSRAHGFNLVARKAANLAASAGAPSRPLRSELPRPAAQSPAAARPATLAQVGGALACRPAR